VRSTRSNREQLQHHRQGQDVDHLGVQQPDHRDRGDVADQQQRQQEHAQLRGAPRPDQGQHPQRERQITRQGHDPAARGRAAGVEAQVQQRRHDHATKRGHRGDGRHLPVAQLAQLQLAADLQPHHQKEQRHQAVVDPLAQILGQLGFPHLDRQAG
jgi:hypothetical protein